jgi:transcriptional regulator with XRE-family HTH domain
MTDVQTIVTKYRSERSFTLRQMASAIGVSRQTIADWEAGKYAPEIGKLLARRQSAGQGWVRELIDELLAAVAPEVTVNVEQEADNGTQ